MKRPLVPGSGRTATARLAAAAVAAAATITVAGSGSPAASAPNDDCPAAFPVADLAADQPVHGLTVSQGTTPEEFTGKVLGVMDDGILPGLDMILVRLSSSEVERAGIWSGMSGSPVYAEDGRLIGAVSYGLSFGPSTVAGVTPAADMQAILSGSPALERLQPAEEVPIPDRIGDRLVRLGVASSEEVDSGLGQLRLPFGLAGLSQKRVRQVAQKTRVDLGTMRMGTLGTTGVGTDGAMVPGGNVAAALSYGDITAAGVGTVTAVCGGEVLAFGHPMMWSGPSTLSMHAARALYVQEDPTFSGFKVANVDPTPIGTITQDRIAAIMGEVGPGPSTGRIGSTVTSDSASRTGETRVAVAEWMPDIAFAHVLSNEDRVFDGIGKGTADLGWVIEGTRADGSPFSVRRDDVFASKYDITFESAWDVAMALYRLQYNDVEDITVDAVTVDSELSRDYEHAKITQTEIREGRVWVTLRKKQPLVLKPGSRQTFRVTMRSDDGGTLRTVRSLRVPRKADGREGALQVTGGNSYYGEDEFFFFDEGSGSEEQTFDDILAGLKTEPRNDDVVIKLSFFDRRGRTKVEKENRYHTGTVVDGGATYRVHAGR